MKINNDNQKFDSFKITNNNIDKKATPGKADNSNKDFEVLLDGQVEKYVSAQPNDIMNFEKINKAKQLIESSEIDSFEFSLLASENILKYGI